MLILLDEDLPRRTEFRSQQQKVEDCQEKAMSVMEALMAMYTAAGDQESVKKINEELETLESECTSVQNRAQEYLDTRADEESIALSSQSCGKSARTSMSTVKEDQIEQWRFESAEKRKHLGELEKQTEAIKPSKTILDPRVIKEKEEEILRDIKMEQQELRRQEMKINLSINQQKQQKENVKTKRGDSASVRIKEHELIGIDLWKQLKILISTFDGNKSTYESWKAAFTAYVDQVPATPEYKLLQLRQHLTGEALRIVLRIWGIQLEPMRKFGG